MKRIVAIDGDIICYSAAFAAADEPVHFCLYTVKRMINSICDATEADEYVCYLTGKGNFREEVATLQGYKENRKDQEKPEHYQAIRDYLVEKHGAIIVDGIEADDALGIAACNPEPDAEVVIATIDKDLLMIPGWNYNWRKGEMHYVDIDEGNWFFANQLFTGDATDNIPGLYKITGQKATKAIKSQIEVGDSYNDMITTVRDVYSEYLQDDPTDILNEIGRLLWIQRNPDEVWSLDYEVEDKEG